MTILVSENLFRSRSSKKHSLIIPSPKVLVLAESDPRLPPRNAGGDYVWVGDGVGAHPVRVSATKETATCGVAEGLLWRKPHPRLQVKNAFLSRSW